MNHGISTKYSGCSVICRESTTNSDVQYGNMKKVFSGKVWKTIKSLGISSKETDVVYGEVIRGMEARDLNGNHPREEKNNKTQ